MCKYSSKFTFDVNCIHILYKIPIISSNVCGRSVICLKYLNLIFMFYENLFKNNTGLKKSKPAS